MSIASDVARIAGAKTMLIEKMTGAGYEVSSRNSLQKLVAILDLGQGSTTPSAYPAGTLNDQINRLSDVRDKLAEKMTASGDYTLTGDELLDELVAMLILTDPPYCLKLSGSADFTLKTSGTSVPQWNNVQYRNPSMSEWVQWDGTEISSSNKKLWIRGTGNTVIGGSNYIWKFSSSVSSFKLYADGNIETLLDWNTVANSRHPTMGQSCFTQLFYNCTALVRAPYMGGISLPNQCYRYMYYGCTSLVEVPDFPEWTTVTGSYHCGNMFENCFALKNAPAIPSKKAGAYTFINMFQKCTSLVKAPDLHVAELGRETFASMFQDCTSLVTAPALAFTKINAIRACNCMFQGCTKLKYPPLLYADKLYDACYANMFRDCLNLRFSKTQTSTYSYPYPLGTVSGTFASDPLGNMFYGTGGTLTGDTIDMVGTTVYCATEPVAA